MRKSFVCFSIFVAILCPVLSSAYTVDWSSVSLSETFPNYSFTDSVLGTVSLSYSNNTEREGIHPFWNNDSTLVLGNDGSDNILTMSFSNPVTNMNIPIWDLDAQSASATTGETLTLSANAHVTLFLPTGPGDVWDSSTLTLSDFTTNTDNDDPDNFSILNFSNPAGFSSINFNFSVNQLGGIGIGDLSDIQVVPIPGAVFLLGSGLVGLSFVRRKNKS